MRTDGGIVTHLGEINTSMDAQEVREWVAERLADERWDFALGDRLCIEDAIPADALRHGD